TSRHPDIVTVSTNGHCLAVADGQTEILVEHLGRKERVLVTVSQTALGGPPSFRQDVEPLLTRAGCNMGACHGKLAGQNGFKLSLRGYAPELDYGWITSDVSARRTNPAFPEESLLLLKALGQVPHEGGQRFATGSAYHRLLAAWIAARVPGPATNEAEALRLEML